MQLLFLAFLLAAQAWAQTDCEKALHSIQAALGGGPTTEVYDDEARERTAAPSVTLEETFAGEHGGKRMILRKTGAHWLSNYRSVRFDPQGDPRWFIETMGAEASEFFGFKVIGDDRVMMPDGKEFTGALEKINARLKAMGEEPVEVSFYTTSGNENTKVTDYIRAFGTAGGIPIAAGGNHLIHDLSFHTGAIFLPPDVARFGKYVARFLDGYLDYLTQKYANDPAKAAAVKHFAYLLRMNHTVTIDTATAMVSPGIVASLRRPGEREAMELLFTPTGLMSAMGQTAYLYFTTKIDSLDPTDMRYLNEYSGLSSSDKPGASQSQRTAAALKNLGITELIAALREYNNGAGPAGHKSLKNATFPPTEEVHDRLCQDVGRRRLLIRDAALALRSGI
jgi:hypothetical protein